MSDRGGWSDVASTAGSTAGDTRGNNLGVSDHSLRRSRSRSPSTRRHSTAAALGHQAHAPEMPYLPGTEWWARPLRDCLMHKRTELPRLQSRSLSVASVCSGTGVENFVMQNLGINVGTYVCADVKQASRTFCKNNHSEITHMFTDLRQLSDPEQVCCTLHPGSSGAQACNAEAFEFDIMFAGPPCQPFTTRRQKTGSSARSGQANVHPDLEVTMQALPELLKTRRPKIAVIEQVLGFGTALPDGTIPLHTLLAPLKEFYPAVRVVEMSASLWSEVPRDRLSVICQLRLPTV
jgi:Holliday junction resolvasome RuvABC endonuclease subunit